MLLPGARAIAGDDLHLYCSLENDLTFFLLRLHPGKIVMDKSDNNILFINDCFFKTNATAATGS